MVGWLSKSTIYFYAFKENVKVTQILFLVSCMVYNEINNRTGKEDCNNTRRYEL